jgi:hypothetical protein
MKDDEGTTLLLLRGIGTFYDSQITNSVEQLFFKDDNGSLVRGKYVRLSITI